MRGIHASDTLAKKFLDVALRNDKLYNFVFSTPLYDLRIDDGYGNPVHSAKHVMHALYEKQKEDPSINMGEMIDKEIIDNLNQYGYHPSILNLLENLEYHVQAEKNGIATFSLDSIKLLDAIKEHLHENKEIYTQANQTYGSEGMWPYIELYDVRMQQSTGRKII